MYGQGTEPNRNACSGKGIPKGHDQRQNHSRGAGKRQALFLARHIREYSRCDLGADASQMKVCFGQADLDKSISPRYQQQHPVGAGNGHIPRALKQYSLFSCFLYKSTKNLISIYCKPPGETRRIRTADSSQRCKKTHFSRGRSQWIREDQRGDTEHCSAILSSFK